MYRRVLARRLRSHRVRSNEWFTKERKRMDNGGGSWQGHPFKIQTYMDMLHWMDS